MKNEYRSMLRNACVAAGAFAAAVCGGTASAQVLKNSVIQYEAKDQAEYFQKWANIYGPLELAAGGTLNVSNQGVTVSAVPFHVGADFSVFDHLKYIAISTQ